MFGGNNHIIKLDTMREIINPRIKIIQNDVEANKLIVSINKNQIPIDLSGYSAVLIVMKESGKYILNSPSIVDNNLEYVMSLQDICEEGIISVGIQLYNGKGMRVSTFEFNVIVIAESGSSGVIDEDLRVNPLLLTLMNQIADIKLKVDSVDIDSITLALEGKRNVDDKIRELDLSEEVIEKISAVNRDGLSAYHLALKNGFIGTEFEWVESLKGKDGIIGIDGTPGKDGEKGSPGSNGINGKDGSPGLPGTNGKDGKDFKYTDFTVEQLAALKGERGEPGLNGLDGRDGVGVSGRDGRDGVDGLDGKSAYNIAVEKGFIGTESEWLLSLKGKDGTGGTSVDYNDEPLKSRITDLETEITKKRNSLDEIVEGDLSQTIKDKLDAIATGEKGDTGRSAYEEALLGGFVGTESEWLLSLKGERGYTGGIGKTGANGIVIDQNAVGGVNGEIKIWTGLQSEYDSIVIKNDNFIYFVRGV